MALNGYKKRAESAVTESSPCKDIVSNKKVSHKTKKRNWACVIYPESLPENWIEILQKTGLQIAISPLHDKDKEPDNKTIKKAHYHVILIFAGPTSFNIVKEITDKLNAPNPISLEAVRGYYRYFTHKDNPEKYQYDEKEIKTLGGFSFLDFVELTRSETTQIKKDLQNLIRKEKIKEYGKLMDFLLDNDLSIEYEVASCNTYFFDKYITSKRHEIKDRKDEVDNSKIKDLVKNAE